MSTTVQEVFPPPSSPLEMSESLRQDIYLVQHSLALSILNGSANVSVVRKDGKFYLRGSVRGKAVELVVDAALLGQT